MKFEIGQTVYYTVPGLVFVDGKAAQRVLAGVIDDTRIDAFRDNSDQMRYHIAGGIWRYEDEFEPSLEALVERLLRQAGQKYRTEMEEIIRGARRVA